MRDSVVPLSVPSSQLYTFGNSNSGSEVHQVIMPSLDISSFCWDSIAFSSSSNYQLAQPPPPPLAFSTPAAAAGFHITPYHHHHQQEPFNVVTTSYDNLPFEAAAAWYGHDGSPLITTTSSEYTTSSSESMVVTNKVASASASASAAAAAKIDNGLYSKQGRKRPIEVSSRATKSSTTTTTTTTAAGKRKKSSSSATISAAGAWQQQQRQMNDQSITIQEFKLQVPVRRSQKLSDKITALQKLVSPYGKTDTASVLQEASLYIKLLQKQIQRLSNTAPTDDSASEAWVTTMEGNSDGELLDLRNRGLCLVPLKLSKKFADQCHVMDPSPYEGDQAEV